MSGLSHTSCSGSTSLTGCPAGGGTLTITGTNFYGANPGAVSVTPAVCNGALTINGGFTQITCTLASGTGTTAAVRVTTNGGTTTGTYTITYG